MKEFFDSPNATAEFGTQERTIFIAAMYGVEQNLQWLTDHRSSIAQWLGQ